MPPEQLLAAEFLIVSTYFISTADTREKMFCRNSIICKLESAHVLVR